MDWEGAIYRAYKKGQADMADEMKEIRQEIVEILKILDNATCSVQAHTLASYMLAAKKRLIVVHRKLKEYL